MSWGDLQALNLASKAFGVAKEQAKKPMDGLQELGAELLDGAEHFAKDRLVDLSAIGAKVKLPLGKAFEHPQLEAELRQNLMKEARKQALRLPRLPSWGAAVNAHHTNTPKELQAALKGAFDCFEVDVRMMKGHDGKKIPVAAHDEGSLAGLTMDEWFSIAGASGRYLKLDFKEAEALPAVMALAQKHGIPDERLVFNLGANPQALRAIRRAFPQATLAFGVPENSVRQAEIAAMAQGLGQPVTFVMHRDAITPQAVAILEGIAPISAWGDQDSRQEREARLAELRAMGVTGMIDLGLQGGP